MGCICGKDAHPDANINRQVTTSILSVFILLPEVPDQAYSLGFWRQRPVRSRHGKSAEGMGINRTSLFALVYP